MNNLIKGNKFKWEAVIGLEVPHAHIHLIPINGVQDINFSKPKLSLAKEEMHEVANSIAEVF